MADEFDQYKTQPADEFSQYKTTTNKAPITSTAGLLPSVARGALDAFEGVGSGVADSIVGLRDLANAGTKAIGMGELPDVPAVLREAGTSPPDASTAFTAGRLGEKAGEFIIPGIMGAKAGMTALPNAKRAGQMLGYIESLIGHVPIELDEPGWKALAIKRLSQQGDSAAPKPVRDFITRILDTNQPPLTFKEARSFYSNAVRKLTPEELQKLSPRMRSELGGFADKLDTALGDAADDHGLGQQYEDAMQEYRTAMRRQAKVQRVKDAVVNVGKSAVGKGIGAGIGGGIGYGLWKELNK